MPVFTIPIHEGNDCHDPDDGKFCSKPGAPSPPGKGKRPRPGRAAGKGPGYVIVFKSQDVSGRSIGSYMYVRDEVKQALTAGESHKLESAKVRLRFTGLTMGHVDAPIKWTAPNGVVVVYVRGQRRNEKTGVGLFHDFDVVGDEQVVPLTRNIGSGRRALRAWASKWIVDRTTQRMRMRQLVRPGD